MTLDEEQNILRRCSGKKNSAERKRSEIIEVSASTTDKINNRLLKSCEAQEERDRKSWLEAPGIYAGG